MGASRDQLLDIVEELAEQAFGVAEGLDHMFMGLYEEVCELLVTERPERWRPTPYGAKRM